MFDPKKFTVLVYQSIFVVHLTVLAPPNILLKPYPNPQPHPKPKYNSILHVIQKFVNKSVFKISQDSWDGTFPQLA